MSLDRLLRGTLLSLLMLPLPAAAEPLWEVGVGAGVLSFPDYRGSDQQRAYPIVFPYLVYRGERFKVDREGIRGLLFNSERVDLDVSLDGAVPVESDRSGARVGMPDLDAMLEIGPSLDLTWVKEEASEVRLRFPLRAAIATDLRHSEQVGWLFNPQLTVSYGEDWEWGGAAGLLYATEGYHDYYYQVTPAFATAERPVYDAHGGFSGTRVTLWTTRRFERIWLGAFLRYDDLSRAEFVDSPLVRQQYSLMGGVSLAWIFSRSAREAAD